MTPSDAAIHSFWTEASERYLAASGPESFYALRARLVAEKIAALRPGAKVLDLGCGGGLLSVALARRGFDVYGADISSEMLAAARDATRGLLDEPNYRFRLVQGAIAPFPWRFEVVIVLGVFPYVRDHESYMRYLAGLVEPGGLLVASFTRRASLFAWKEVVSLLSRHPKPSGWRQTIHNLMTSGLWSGGVADRAHAGQVCNTRSFARLFARNGYRRVDHLDFYHWPRWDEAAANRGFLGQAAARLLGWCHVGFYVEKSVSQAPERSTRVATSWMP